MAAYLELDGIAVEYGTTTALHALTLAVEPGEFFCLLGPSGCGKTTTLNVVAGFLQVSRGRVLLAGQDVTALPPQQRRVGLVFQSYALFPHMTALANIAYGLKLKKLAAGEIERRVSALLTLVRLEGKGERYPRQLSGGEQQRVALARALAIEPRLLLLDEPLSNLDARLREEMRTELKRIQRETGVTTVFVTHDQEEAFGVADRVAVLNLGRLEQLGTPTEIYTKPKSLFVARFIGRSNQLRVTADAAAGTVSIARHSLRCAHAASGAPSYIWFLRPEELTISRGAAMSSAANPANMISGTVSEIVYGGAVITCRVKTAIGELEGCRLAGAAGAAIVAGDTVVVAWSPGAGALLPE